MAIDVTLLETRRDALMAEIATVSSHPNYTVEGINVDWQTYEKMLYEKLESLNKLISQMSGPCIEVTYGF